MILKGFKFGMLLQLSIGPMCLLVFNTAGTHGLMKGLMLVCAIALVDAVYIALAGIGIASVLDKDKIKWAFRLFGCIVLVIFGANTILNVFSRSILPDIQLFSKLKSCNVFLQGLLLTASNPLTILFWGGVLSSQVISQELSKHQIVLFGLGSVLSTITFLSCVAVLGSLANTFLPVPIIQGFNILVGFILIIFGIRLTLKKTDNTTSN